MTDYRYQLTLHNDKLTQSSAQPRFFVRTYGCQMNSRDSEKIEGLLSQLGYKKTTSQDDADIILFNTCCVRESAEDRIFGNIGRLKALKAQKPNLIIGILGCMTQQAEIAEKIRQKYKYVNMVFGTFNRHRLPEFIWKTISTGKQIIDINEDTGLPEIEDIEVTHREYAHKAGVNIMYGCSNFCSYCIVPYVRGAEKSRKITDILQEINALAADGVKEIMLLGQNVNSFVDEHGNLAFAKLLHLVNNIEGIARIRFMTSHPKDLSEELIVAIATLPKICKFLHLPIQSGSSRILQDMNRKYTKEDYLTLISRLKSKIPDIAISTDIIVGYPGETEEDFLETLDIVQKVQFANAFTFLYSKRSGTPAASRTDIVPAKIASERYDRLVAALTPIHLQLNEQKLGKIFDAIIEEKSPEPNGYKGRLDDHSLIHISSKKALHPGNIVPVEITQAKTFYLNGTAV